MDPLFPEPIADDPTWARSGEQVVDWLRRSTTDRARQIRSFLNHALARLPADARATIAARLEREWAAAFFELVVGRTLQELGAAIEYEASTPSGKRIDWLATFPDGRVGVEATAPMIDAGIGSTMRRRQPTLDLIVRLTPPGWTVIAISVPELAGDASRRPIRAVLERWAAQLQSMDPPVEAEFVQQDLPGGDLHLIYRPVAAEQVIQLYPAASYWDDSKVRIRAAVEAKKEQVRGAEWPVLVAVHGSGLSTDLDDFDLALLGTTVDVLSLDRRLIEARFDPTGLFGEQRPEPPSLAGVLAYVNTGPLRADEPVLYLHPRSDARLPMALSRLEQRQLGGAGIERREGSGDSVMAGLRLADTW